jgi:small neutral amino acid transporter SnatA (MarC family)
MKAAAAAALIPARCLPPSHLAGVAATVAGAVDLAPVAMAADQRLPAAKRAQEQTAAIAVLPIATPLDAPVSPWTRSAFGAMMMRQSCSGAV